MSCAIERGDFPPWNAQKHRHHTYPSGEHRMSDPNRDARKAELQERQRMLHELYMDTPINSSAEKYYEEQLEQVMLALDEIARDEQAEWGADDDRILREQIADAAYGNV
jgi:hypothetical protein